MYNMNIQEKDLQNIWHPFTQQWNQKENIVVEKAQGVWLHTNNGKILDAVSSWWVNLFGHANPTVANAIAKQASELEHVIFAGFTHQPAIDLSEKLLAILPDSHSKIFFSDNGSTSVEVALKMAFQYWYNKKEQRKKVIAIEGSYHGDTFGAMAVAERNAFSEPFNPFLFEVDFIPFPNGENDDLVIDRFTELVKTGEVASFIFEPLLQGTAGMRTYAVETLNKLIEIGHQYGVICIADEVMTGFGRTGKIFASDYLTEKPDIFCMSKGITGGFMAMGITSCTKQIHQAYIDEDKMKTFFHGHSYTGNAMACAAGNASIDLLTSTEMQNNIKRIEEQHTLFAERCKNEWNLMPEKVSKINQIGTVISIELKTNESSSYFNNLRDFLYNHFLDRGILLRPLGNVIYILPPYVITNEELDLIYTEIKDLCLSL